MKNEFEYEAELAALREELARYKDAYSGAVKGRAAFRDSVRRLRGERTELQQRLAAAEQRNADAVRLLTALYDATPIVWPDVADFLALTKPTESGASE
jgi:uncharacterized protein (DUF3084 family)